jgi:hypothetical protein
VLILSTPDVDFSWIEFLWQGACIAALTNASMLLVVVCCIALRMLLRPWISPDDQCHVIQQESVWLSFSNGSCARFVDVFNSHHKLGG